MDIQLMKEACIVCCPLCDEDKCVGRYECEEIKRYMKKRKEYLQNGVTQSNDGVKEGK